ncbi:serine acetyltransferase [Sphingosinicella sp. BN140058]|uniref:serine acetyltransferase n=1 Tax=Sphingosinicella sp. BN140058 TaxID=1892855 RepID=UPI00101136AF|nr:serine acetyltransferase [Sphingosinicella sp. BN140058]QAY77489.1 serine acetyltransferase [Sphingosinicella sp. BN140058]
MSPLDADIFRATARGGWGQLIKLMIKSRTFRPIATLRAYQALRRRSWGRPLAPIAAIAHRLACHGAAIDLPLRTAIGHGFAIAHGWGIVVNQHARIGRNVTLFHGATIGQGDRIARDGSRETFYPVIEDDVWIGPHAVVVGAVTVGAGSRILAGAVVTADVPPASIVAGNPGTIVKQDCVPDVTNRVILTAPSP